MKLNKYLFSTFIAASALLISSCSDFLDRSPQGQFTEDDNPNALVNGKIYNVYTMMRSYDITAGTTALAIHCLRSEDEEKGSIASDGSDVAEMYDDFKYTASNGLLCGLLGERTTPLSISVTTSSTPLPKKKLPDRPKPKTSSTKGEASFFRAYCYFNLVRAFGEVPLVTYKITTLRKPTFRKPPSIKSTSRLMPT